MTRKFVFPLMTRVYPAAEMVGMLVDSLEFSQEVVKESKKDSESSEAAAAVLGVMAKAFRDKADEIEKYSKDLTASDFLKGVMHI